MTFWIPLPCNGCGEYGNSAWLISSILVLNTAASRTPSASIISQAVPLSSCSEWVVRTYSTKKSGNALLAAALLHDVGHGPFSHVFERITKGNHERWTLMIVRSDQEISDILNSDSCKLHETVCDILNGTYRPHYVTALISSQLDVDRFDYLLRDAHMTGAQYGAFDLEWMIRTLAVQEIPTTGLKTVVVDGRRGISGLESYLIGRHYMYQHMYHHKTIRAAEMMLQKIVDRAIWLHNKDCSVCSSSVFEKIARDQRLSVGEYLSLDDFVVMGWVREWSHSAKDKTLRCLSARLMNRKLLKPIVIKADLDFEQNMDARNRLRELVQSTGCDPDYYVLRDRVSDAAYKGYLLALEQGTDADEGEIWFVDEEDIPRRLSSRRDSVLVQATSALKYQEDRWYVPGEVAEEAREQVYSMGGDV